MKAKSKVRKLRVESLEKRAMLDGNLAVSVVQGMLVVTGDANSNVVTISPPQPGTAGTKGVAGISLLITPDSNTSVNGGAAGVALAVSGVTAGGKIDLGGGGDSLTLQGGVDLPGSLSIQTGTGSGKVSISDFHCTRLSIGSQGSDGVDISNTNVDTSVVLQGQQGLNSATLTNDTIGLAPNAGTPLTLVSLSSTNFGLKLKGTRTGASAVATFDKQGGAVSIAANGDPANGGVASSIGGGISVTSKGPLDFSMTEQSSCALDVYLKLDSTSAKSPPTIELADSSVGGSLIVASRGAENVQVSNFNAASMYLKLDSSPGLRVGGSVALDHIKLSGPLSVTGDTVRKAMFQWIKADSAYLKFDGLQASGAADDAAASLDRITLTGGLFVDATFPALDAASKDAAKMTIKNISSDRVTLKFANPSLATAASVSETDVDCSGRLEVSSTGPVDFSASGIKASNYFLKLDGIKGSSLADSATLDSLTLTGGLFVTSSTSVDVSATSVQASDLFMKLDLKGSRLADTASLSGITLTGGLFVDGNAMQALSIDGIKGQRIHIKLDNSNLQDRSKLVLADVDADGQLDVVSRGALDIVARGGGGGAGGTVQASHAAGIFIKLEGLAGQAAPSSVALTDWNLDGALDVISRGALNFSIGQMASGGAKSAPVGGLQASSLFMKIEDLRGNRASSNIGLNNLDLAGRLDVRTGAGDDTLAISNSKVGGPAYLNGGAGNDTLIIDKNSSFAVEPIEISWETMELKVG
jgi:hypothetical protein